MTTPAPVTEPTAADGHERRDVVPRWVVVVGVAILLLVVGTGIGMIALQRSLAERETAASPPASPLAGSAPQEPPAPRLQTDPRGDLAQLHAWEHDQLGAYGWVDREHGVVRVPIDRAIEMLLARRGLAR